MNYSFPNLMITILLLGTQRFWWLRIERVLRSPHRCYKHQALPIKLDLMKNLIHCQIDRSEVINISIIVSVCVHIKKISTSDMTNQRLTLFNMPITTPLNLRDETAALAICCCACSCFCFI